jgi:hypothetical protein
MGEKAIRCTENGKWNASRPKCNGETEAELMVEVQYRHKQSCIALIEYNKI